MAKANPVQKTSNSSPISYLLAAKAMAPAYWLRKKLGEDPERLGSRISSSYEKYGDAISKQKPLLAERAYAKAKRFNPAMADSLDLKEITAHMQYLKSLVLKFEKSAASYKEEAADFERLFDSLFKQGAAIGARNDARRNQAHRLSCASECLYEAAKVEEKLGNASNASRLQTEAQMLSNKALFILKVNLELKPSDIFYPTHSTFGLVEILRVEDAEYLKSKIAELEKKLLPNSINDKIPK